MKLQARLLLVYSILFIGAVGVLFVERAIDTSRAQTILQHELTNRRAYFEKLVSLEGSQIESLATDYSYWDEMVDFVHHPTKDWSTQNVDTALTTYKVDAAWIYNPKNKLVYYSSADGVASATNIALPPEAFAKLAKDHFDHFYVKEPDGLMEIRAATIVPTTDYTHDTPAQGYWLLGRYVNADHLKKMSDLAQSAVTLDPPAASPADKTTTSTVSFGTSLNGWDGQSLGVLRLTAQVPVEKDLGALYDRQLLLLAAFFAASALLVVGSMWWLVLRPVKTIAGAIRNQKPEQLDPVAREHTEFGNLAEIVQLSFRQKQKIDESEFLKTKLEELNTAKGEFLAIAAHELRGPVGNVNIFTANLSDLVEEGKVDKKVLHTEVERINQQAHKANVLINDMYQASKGGRTLEFAKKEFDFDAFIKEEVQNAQYSTVQKIGFEGATGRKIISDPDRLGQVMSNLIRNASKYSPNDRHIIVRVSHHADEVQVEVEDFGLGIDPADQPKLFQRFYRSSRVAKDYPGLGLGLSVCKEIVEGLGGRIWLASTLEVGSHFYFALPVSPPDREIS